MKSATTKEVPVSAATKAGAAGRSSQIKGGPKALRTAFSSKLASLCVIVIAVMWTIPTVGLFITSLRGKMDVASSGWWTVFTHPKLTLQNYQDVLFADNFGVSGGLAPYVVNSLAICIPATIIPIVIATMAAYCLAWIPFKGSDTIFFFIFSLQVVPVQMALIPLLQMYTRGLHIGSVMILPPVQLGVYTKVWLTGTMFLMPTAVYLIHNFIATLPRDLIEAARVDGASHFRIFWQIIVPLSLPAIASMAIFQFIWTWNDLLVALVFAGGSASQAQTLTSRLSQLAGAYGSQWELMTAGAFLSILVPLTIFFALQRYFVRGLLAGSVKG